MHPTLRKIAVTALGSKLYDCLLYSNFCRRRLHHLGLPTGRAEGEREYRRRWREFTPYVDPYIYRLFSHFCGSTPDIIPEDVMHRVIEQTLNPRNFWDVYEDKNMFPLVVGAANAPATVASRIGGDLPVDANFRPITNLEQTLLECNHKALILKPSVGTSCGDRVMKFYRNGTAYETADGTRLSPQFLMLYGNDWVLQQAIEQHPFTARYCATATNTMRMVVYRSVRDYTPHVTSAYFRYGGNGAVVDNAHGGGRYVAVDPESGVLADTMYDEYGNSYPFTDSGTAMPCWDTLVAFSCHIAMCIPHHHLFALDVALDSNGKPMLLEYNIGGFSSHAGYYVGQTVFGPYLDEVIDYCRQRIKQAR